MSKIREYKTSDIGLAAIFISGGKILQTDGTTTDIVRPKYKSMHPIQGRNVNIRGREMFHFIFDDSDPDNRRVITNAYAGKRILVEPATFQSTIRDLKQQVKEYYQNEDE